MQNGKAEMTGDGTPSDADPLADGRQSEAARQIARGARRCLFAHGFAAIPEVPLASGRRADLLALHRDGTLWIVEIKSSLVDFRTDRKWSQYREFCDRLLFAVLPDFPLEILPGDAGLIVADRFGGELIRSGPENRLPAARRKAVTARFARLAALRLLALADPDLALEALQGE